MEPSQTTESVQLSETLYIDTLKEDTEQIPQDIVIDIETPSRNELDVIGPKYSTGCTLIVLIGATLITYGIIVLIFDNNDPYYFDIESDRVDLIDQLHTLIASNTRKLQYDNVWCAFGKTDIYWETERCKKVTDGISDLFNYKDCFTQASSHGITLGTLTREHIWPKSWWECGDSCPDQDAYSDLHLLFPGEAVGNNQRGTLPYGLVKENLYSNSQTFIGWKKGFCVSDPTHKCVEPPDQWKGVLARATLYVSVRYRGIFKYPCESLNGQCANNIAVKGSYLNDWFEQTMRDWHHSYPVTDPEQKRNEAVYALQGNRNPFVDHPEYVDRIPDF